MPTGNREYLFGCVRGENLEVLSAATEPATVAADMANVRERWTQAILSPLAQQMSEAFDWEAGSVSFCMSEYSAPHFLIVCDTTADVVPTPRDFSVSTSREADKLHVHITPPNDGVDTYRIYGAGFPRKIVPATDSLEIDLRRRIEGNRNPIILVSWRHGQPSAPAVMFYGRGRQYDRPILPLSGGKLPNWRLWNATGGNVELHQAFQPPPLDLSLAPPTSHAAGTSEGVTDELPEAPYLLPFDYWLDEPLAEIYLSSSAGNCGGGIYRRFLGLASGKSYRITGSMDRRSEKSSVEWKARMYAALAPNDMQFDLLREGTIESYEILTLASEDAAPTHVRGSVEVQVRNEEVIWIVIELVGECESGIVYRHIEVEEID
jgi:hypothetical protein